MRKKADEELGIILTREIQAMMFDDRITADQKVRIFCSIVRDEPLDDPLMASYAQALKVGYEYTNKCHRDQIYARRERQREYQHARRESVKNDTNLRTSMEINLRTSTEMSEDRRALPIKGNGKGNGNDIPLNPPSGVDGRIPEAVSADDILGVDEVAVMANAAAERIEKTEAFAHMRVNRGKLMKCLISVLKKNGGAVKDIEVGLAAWTESWKADGWAYVPGRITDWIYDGKYLEAPRVRKPEQTVGAGCGECGVVIG